MDAGARLLAGAPAHITGSARPPLSCARYHVPTANTKPMICGVKCVLISLFIGGDNLFIFYGQTKHLSN